MQYRCATCGQLHNELPDMDSDRPAAFWAIPEAERNTRIQLTSDTCVIDKKDFLILTVLEIPIHDYAQRFGFGVWVSQSEKNFYAYLNNPESSALSPTFGWLCTHLSCYDIETIGLKTRAHFRGSGKRPSIELEPTDHPLAVNQREGITLTTAWEMVHKCLDKSPRDGEKRS